MGPWIRSAHVVLNYDTEKGLVVGLVYCSWTDLPQLEKEAAEKAFRNNYPKMNKDYTKNIIKISKFEYSGLY